jgi:hypothetical protein
MSLRIDHLCLKLHERVTQLFNLSNERVQMIGTNDSSVEVLIPYLRSLSHRFHDFRGVHHPLNLILEVFLKGGRLAQH